MAKKVFNVQGGLHSEAAFAALENAIYGGSVKAKTTDFLLSPGSGMQVSISRGNGLIDTGNDYGYRIQTDAAEVATVAAASASFNRIDTVVAYFDTGVVPTTAVVDNINNVLKFACVAGTAASTPAAPTGAAIQSAIGAGNPYFILGEILVPQNASNLSAATFTDKAKTALDASQTGWNSFVSTLTYSSYSSTTKVGVIGTTVDLRNRIQVGHRIKFDQSSGTKIGIVHAITASTITIFFGQSFSLSNQSISNAYFSVVDNPLGFIATEDVWCVVMEDILNRTQNSPTVNVWYNPGGLGLTVGIGKWKITASFNGYMDKSTGALASFHSILYTSNNAGDVTSKLYRRTYGAFTGANGSAIMGPVVLEDIINLASQTTYYLNILSDVPTSAALTIWGSQGKTFIKAVSAYL